MLRPTSRPASRCTWRWRRAVSQPGRTYGLSAIPQSISNAPATAAASGCCSPTRCRPRPSPASSPSSRRTCPSPTRQACFAESRGCDSRLRAHLRRRYGAFASACSLSLPGRSAAPRTMGGLPMTTEKSQNVQDVFLNHLRKNKTPVTVFLVNGVKLQGIITWFDNFCVLLRRDAHSQLVYKHAISTVMPAQPIQLFEGGKEGGEL